MDLKLPGHWRLSFCKVNSAIALTSMSAFIEAGSESPGFGGARAMEWMWHLKTISGSSTGWVQFALGQATWFLSVLSVFWFTYCQVQNWILQTIVSFRECSILHLNTWNYTRRNQSPGSIWVGFWDSMVREEWMSRKEGRRKKRKKRTQAAKTNRSNRVMVEFLWSCSKESGSSIQSSPQRWCV